MMHPIRLSGCLIFKNGKVLLVKRNNSDCWEIPCGIIEPGENPEDTAIKSTENQTGVKAQIIQQFDIVEFQKQGTNIEKIFFESDVVEETERIEDSSIETAEWVDIRDLEREKLTDDIELMKKEIIKYA